MTRDPSTRLKPNIRMVAKRVQLSATTVSLALRGDYDWSHKLDHMLRKDPLRS
jgi:hypothetical protein